MKAVTALTLDLTKLPMCKINTYCLGILPNYKMKYKFLLFPLRWPKRKSHNAK